MKPVRIILFGLVCGIVSTAHADIASVQYVQSIISSLEPPTVNNAVLTIQKNGTTVDTFTANASVDKAINITVPTTAADVGAVPTSRTVNSKALSSDITLTASDVGAEATANKSTSSTYATDLANNSKKDVNYPTLAAAEQIAINAAADAASDIVNGISDDGSGGNVVVDVFPNDGVIGFTRGFAYDTIDVIGEGSVVTSIGQSDDDNVIVATMGTLSASDVGAVASSQATKGGVLTTNATTGAVEVSSTIAASKVSGLATVATTGAYSDLTGAPTIPTVNDATLTIQKNGTAVDTFTANASVNKTINITVPTTAADVDAVPTSRTVNGSALSSNITLDGADIALTGYTKPNATSAIAAADTINAAIGKLETALDGKQASGSYVPTTTTVAGHALSSNVTLSNSDVGLGNVQNVDQTNAANITSGTMSVARLPVGTTSTTVAAGDDARFDSVPTSQPAGTPPTGRVWVWFN